MKHKFIAKRFWKDYSTAMSSSQILARQFDDCINLSLGDPDLVTDSGIINAAFNDALAGHTKYTDFRGDLELRAAIIDYYKKDLGISIKDEEVMVSCACMAMNLALQAILDDGDEVIIHAPYYTPVSYTHLILHCQTTKQLAQTCRLSLLRLLPQTDCR